MCRIAGFIGQSKDPELSYQIITNLFEKAEIRGRDASGYWGSNFNKVIYHKEPTKPSDFIKKDAWKQIRDFNPSLLLVHAREATRGCGPPIINKNNHPFVNSNKTMALIHNGRVAEYEFLRHKYQLLSDCDSEILLRMIEGFYPHNLLDGIKKLWGHTPTTKMAVAIGSLEQNNHSLFLFRNEHRPIWVIDMRDQLGQIFFCSTANLWTWAVSKISHKLSKIQLISLPKEQVWALSTSKEKPVVDEFSRFEVVFERETTLQYGGELNKIKLLDKTVDIETELNELEELPIKITYGTNPPIHSPLIGDSCEELTNICDENSFDQQEYDEVYHYISSCKSNVQKVLDRRKCKAPPP